MTNNPGRIFENLFIIPLPARGDNYAAVPADVHAYDTRTGKLVWVFHSVPHPGEFGYETWPKDFWKTGGGVHNWNEMTVDEKRGVAYIPFGTARYDFYGANRHGQRRIAPVGGIRKTVAHRRTTDHRSSRRKCFAIRAGAMVSRSGSEIDRPKIYT
jgi:hypothetical protein